MYYFSRKNVIENLLTLKIVCMTGVILHAVIQTSVNSVNFSSCFLEAITIYILAKLFPPIEYTRKILIISPSEKQISSGLVIGILRDLYCRLILNCVGRRLFRLYDGTLQTFARENQKVFCRLFSFFLNVCQHLAKNVLSNPPVIWLN